MSSAMACATEAHDGQMDATDTLEAMSSAGNALCQMQSEAREWRLRCFQAEAQLRLSRQRARGAVPAVQRVSVGQAEQHPRFTARAVRAIRPRDGRLDV